MAVILANGRSLVIDAVDLSAYVTSVTVNRAFDEIEVTAMGDSAHVFTKGLEANSITIEFLNDMTAASGVNAVLSANFGTVVTVVAKPTAAAVSATNPSYSGSVLINNITPLNGAVGDIATQSVTWNYTTVITEAVA